MTAWSGQDGAGRSGAKRSTGMVRIGFVPVVLLVGASAVSAIVTKELTHTREAVASLPIAIEKVAASEVDPPPTRVVAARARLEQRREIGTIIPVVEQAVPTASGSSVLLWRTPADAGPILQGMGGELYGPPSFLAGGFVLDESMRWFDGRPVRPVRVQWMTVTAYSPDEASCGESADGITATLHCVTTNSGLLVAADPKVLPYGSMLTIPGYGIVSSDRSDNGESSIVPVLDCGGAIKGYRLDVLFATHAEARRWGVQQLPVTVWGYADGGEHTNPRRVR
jgi:3D (Asp-Asp-Asp) domain-containing protein